MRTWPKPLSFSVVGEFPMSGASFSSFQLLFPSFMSDNDRWLTYVLVSQLPSVPIFSVVGEFPMSGASFSSFQLLFPSFMSDDDRWLTYVLVSQLPSVPI